MIRYDTAPEAAEAALSSAGDEHSRLEDEIAVLEVRMEQIEAEEWSTRRRLTSHAESMNFDAKINDLQAPTSSWPRSICRARTTTGSKRLTTSTTTNELSPLVVLHSQSMMSNIVDIVRQRVAAAE